MAASCGVRDLQKCTLTDPLLYTIDLMGFLVDDSLCLRFSPYIHLDTFYNFPNVFYLDFLCHTFMAASSILAYLFLQGYTSYS